MPASYRNRVGVVLGLMGACALGATQGAQAQSSVTLYGVLDASVLYTNKTLNTTNGQSGPHQYSFNDCGVSGSHFGLRGVEDLGGGMRAIFQLESGISIANGALSNSNGNLFGRQAWVGIDSQYGTVKAGLQFSPFFLAAYDFDP